MIFDEYIGRLIDASPIRLYTSGTGGARFYWPWRMNKAGSKEFRQAYVEAAGHHILDSNFNDESVTNVDVLDAAAEHGCDGAVLADVYQDGPATVDALLDGLELYDGHRFDGLVVLPLQEPYEKAYREVEPSTNSTDVWWALGGLKDAPAAVKIQAAIEFRQEVGPGPHVHGLGWGLTRELAAAVRRDNWLLDSVDSSTATQDALKHGFVPGDEVSTPYELVTLAYLCESLRLTTDYVEGCDDPTRLRHPNQTGLEQVASPTMADGGDPTH